MTQADRTVGPEKVASPWRTCSECKRSTQSARATRFHEQMSGPGLIIYTCTPCCAELGIRPWSYEPDDIVAHDQGEFVARVAFSIGPAPFVYLLTRSDGTRHKSAAGELRMALPAEVERYRQEWLSYLSTTAARRLAV